MMVSTIAENILSVPRSWSGMVWLISSMNSCTSALGPLILRAALTFSMILRARSMILW